MGSRRPVHPISHELAERALLGLAMTSDRAALKVMQLGPNAFACPIHAEVMTAIIARHGRGQPLDRLSIFAELKSRGTHEMVGGISTLEVIASAAVSASLDSHLRLVVDAHRVRSVQTGASSIAERGLDPAVLNDPDSYIAAATEIGKAARLALSSSAVDAATAVHSAFESFIARTESKRPPASPTGHAQLDALLDGGLWAGSLHTIAARPTLGKSAIMLMMILAGSSAGHPQFCFSLEMGTADLIGRMICMVADIPARAWRTGQASDDQKRAALGAARLISQLPIWFDDETSAWSAIEARAEAWICDEAAAVTEQNEAIDGCARVPVWWVDYLQLASSPADSREREIASMTRGAKLLAKRTKSAGVLLAQIGRSSEKEKRPPELHDLRESGAIEQDSNVVLFLHWPNGRPMPSDPLVTITQAIVRKNRDSGPGTVDLGWTRSRTRFGAAP